VPPTSFVSTSPSHGDRYVRGIHADQIGPHGDGNRVGVVACPIVSLGSQVPQQRGQLAVPKRLPGNLPLRFRSSLFFDTTMAESSIPSTTSRNHEDQGRFDHCHAQRRFTPNGFCPTAQLWTRFAAHAGNCSRCLCYKPHGVASDVVDPYGNPVVVEDNCGHETQVSPRGAAATRGL